MGVLTKHQQRLLDTIPGTTQRESSSEPRGTFINPEGYIKGHVAYCKKYEQLYKDVLEPMGTEINEVNLRKFKQLLDHVNNNDSVVDTTTNEDFTFSGECTTNSDKYLENNTTFAIVYGRYAHEFDKMGNPTQSTLDKWEVKRLKDVEKTRLEREANPNKRVMTRWYTPGSKALEVANKRSNDKIVSKMKREKRVNITKGRPTYKKITNDDIKPRQLCYKEGE